MLHLHGSTVQAAIIDSVFTVDLPCVAGAAQMRSMYLDSSGHEVVVAHGAAERLALSSMGRGGRIYVSIDPTQSVEMIALAEKLLYEPMQEKPYPVTAVFHDPGGHAFEKQYFRIDFLKSF